MSRPDDFDAMLSRLGATDENFMEAARYYAAKSSRDLELAAMQQAMTPAEGGEDLNRAMQALTADMELTKRLCRETLRTFWEEGDRDAVEEAISEAGSKLILVELTIGATCGLYLAYLKVTGGRKSRTHQRTIRPDGAVTETTSEEWYPFPNPVAPISNLLKRWGESGSPT